MVGVGRDLCGSPSPTPLPKQGHLQQAAEDLVQAGLEYLQRRRLHNLPGQPGPGLRHPQSEEILPHVQTELPVLQFVPIAPRICEGCRVPRAGFRALGCRSGRAQPLPAANHVGAVEGPCIAAAHGSVLFASAWPSWVTNTITRQQWEPSPPRTPLHPPAT